MGEHRITELEAKLAYQEVLLNEMSDVLYQQQQQLDLLGSRFSRLLERVHALESGSEAPDSGDEPPPHY